MYPIINKILENEDIKQIQKNLGSDEITNVSITGVTDSTKAHIIYALTCRGNKSSIIVCSNVIQANKIMQDLKFFSNLEIIDFPAKNIQYHEKEWLSEESIVSENHNSSILTLDSFTPSYVYGKYAIPNTVSRFGRSDLYINTPREIRVESLI